MVAGSILPVSIYKNKIYFLFGKENPLEPKESSGWSDFGGSCEKNETPYNTSIREATEELTGFLGNKTQIRKKIQKGFYKLKVNNYHMFILYIPFDKNLPYYFNNNHLFLWNKINNKYLKNTKFFEKIEIKWFDVDNMKENINIFRPFYKKNIKLILKNIDNIKKYIDNFINKKKLHNKTIKNNNNFK